MPNQITGSKLLSNGQVLQTLFYNKCQLNLETRDAEKLKIQEIYSFGRNQNYPQNI